MIEIGENLMIAIIVVACIAMITILTWKALEAKDFDFKQKEEE